MAADASSQHHPLARLSGQPGSPPLAANGLLTLGALLASGETRDVDRASIKG